LPKGHIEKNEQTDIAAMREVEEETAIKNLSIIKQLPSSHHCYLLNGQWTLKKTSWFLMKSDDDFKPKPQEEEGISRVYLINKDNVKDFLENTYPSIRLALEEDILEVVRS
jgi:8-oxo-dGTP pyrophosphatase MutT (NUDIX family)